MRRHELVDRYPQLYHVAFNGTWPSISARGLLSTTALLDLFEIEPSRRRSIEAARRPENVHLCHPVHGRVVIRDNKPLIESRLVGCLEDGLGVEDWYRTINARVFLWPNRKRVDRLLQAEAYRTTSHVVLTIRTGRLVAAHHDAIAVTTINSGATKPLAWPRGLGTFQRIPDFDYAARRHRGKDAVAEVTVDYAVPDIADMVELVACHRPDGSVEQIWP